jgi:hypothetical protein
MTEMIEGNREKMIEIKMTEESRQDLTGDNSEIKPEGVFFPYEAPDRLFGHKPDCNLCDC